MVAILEIKMISINKMTLSFKRPQVIPIARGYSVNIPVRIGYRSHTCRVILMQGLP